MSGHSKWAKLKHVKGAADVRKSKLLSMHARVLAVAVKEAGGDKNAPSVRAAIERARKDNVSNDNIERAILRGQGAGGENYAAVIYEAFGPGGVALLIEALTDNNNRTSHEIKHLLSQHGSALGAPGSAVWAFRREDNAWRASMPVPITDSDMEKLLGLIDALEEHDDVQNVFAATELPEREENGL